MAKTKAATKAAVSEKTAAAGAVTTTTPDPAYLTTRVHAILESIHPNPYQPATRIQIDEETKKRFGESILEHGLLQVPIARLKPGCAGEYEIGDGWLRYAGHQWLVSCGHQEYNMMPLDIRPLTNQEMAELVIEANSVRKDLNPIDEALLFKRCIDEFGMTETELGRKHGRTQGAIANTLRLLNLPEPIKEAVKTGELHETHARELLRVNSLPDIQKNITTQALRDGLSVNQVAQAVDRTLWDRSLSLSENSYPKPVFDVNVECKGCPKKVLVAEPYGNRKKFDRCTDKICWNKKNKLAEAQVKKEAAEKLAKQAKGKKLFTQDNLSYNQYEDFAGHTKVLAEPEECAKCEKRGLYKYKADTEGEPREICTDPACFRKKKSARTREIHKVEKQQDVELTTKLTEIFKHAAENPWNCVVVMAKALVPRLQSNDGLDLLKAFPDLPKTANGRIDGKKVLKHLEQLTLDELLEMGAAAAVIQSRRNAGYEQFSTKLKDPVARDVAILSGKLKQFDADILKWQETNCVGCTHCFKDKIGTDEEHCTRGYSPRLDDGGRCLARLAREDTPVLATETPAATVGLEPPDDVDGE